MYKAGKSKEYIRNSVFLYLKNSEKILSLPHTNFDLELKLSKHGSKVTTIERNLDIL